MEYNTQREKLKISDYGRNVVKLINYTKQLPTKEERNRMAGVILDVMAQLNPKVKERTDYKHILWDHLMLMADYSLDVDCPYPISREENESFHPHPMRLHTTRIRYPHYGRALEDMIKAVAAMPEGMERTLLTSQIAHTMKRQYLQWNRDTVDNQLIVEQLNELSEGRLTLPEGFRFHDSKELLESIGQTQNRNGDVAKKKKKKKKKSNG